MAPERRLAGEHLEGRAREGIDVGPAVKPMSFDLLGRDVVQSAEELAGGGQAGDSERCLAEAEVGQVDVVRAVRDRAGVEQHVGRLDVAVHETAGVRGIERGRHLRHDLGDLIEGQHAKPVDERPDVAPADIAHRDEQHPVGFACLEYGRDMRIVDRGGRAGLTDESLPERGVVAEGWRQELERDLPVQPGVVGAEDDGHSAMADALFKAVTGDQRANAEFSSA